MKDSIQKLIQVWKEQVSPRLSSLLSALWVTGLAIASLGLWAFVAIADEVLERETEAFDTAVLQTFYSFHTPLLSQIMIGFTFLGEPELLVVICIVFGAILSWQRKWIDAIILGVTASGAIGLNYLLKDLFSRTRPALWDRIIDVNSYSFPSGHAMISFVVYGFLGYWFMSQFRSWRYSILITTIFLVSAIGLSRMYLGVHWPTDVFAGYAAGLVWLSACILSLEVARKYFRTRLPQEKQF